MHPLYQHSLNSVYQNLPLIVIPWPGGAHLPFSRMRSSAAEAGPLHGISGVSGVGGEEGLASRDAGSILSAPCAPRACRTGTAKVLTCGPGTSSSVT